MNFMPLSREDLNLNGVLDAGEDGANGGVANGVLDQVALARGVATPVFIPRIGGAIDCIYLGAAFRVDPNAVNLFSVQHEPVISQYVSMNSRPVAAGATPVADRVVNVKVAKKFGKMDISWDTSAEFTTVGFNLIGTKRNGRDVQLNAQLIPAKNGTTGDGASYSVSVSAGALKGSTAVYVEIVKTNGAKERFGPASF
jgi:hypothetical protein